MDTSQQQANNSVEAQAGADREVWVRNQVLVAMRMALALNHAKSVRADEDAFEGGLLGVAEGASIEILRILGFSTHNLVNLTKGKKRATIAELEKILNSGDDTRVEIRPDGSCRAV